MHCNLSLSQNGLRVPKAECGNLGRLGAEQAAMTYDSGSGEGTVGSVIAGQAIRRPGAPAIVGPDLEALSYGDLARQSELIGAQFRAAGVSSDSRIGIALPRGPAAAILSIAACCFGILV